VGGRFAHPDLKGNENACKKKQRGKEKGGLLLVRRRRRQKERKKKIEENGEGEGAGRGVEEGSWHEGKKPRKKRKGGKATFFNEI